MPNIYEHRAKLTSLLAGQSGGPDTQALFDTITREYATAYKAIQARADRLAKDIADKSASGEGFSLSEAHRDERIQSILGTAGAELVKFASRASMDTRHAQRRALDDAYSDAKRYVRIAEGTSALNAFTNINPDVATAFIGHAADGSPLVQVFGEMVPDGVAAVRSAIVQSLLLGENPTLLANRLRRELGAPLVRAQTVARTEVMRAYRESSLGIYQANSDLVKGWIWHANLSVNTCAFCIANHGSRHAIDEHMASHPSCRCAMVPLTKSWEELGYDRNPALDTRADTGANDGRNWFNNQPPDVQRAILGKGKYDEYAAGRLKLSQLIGQRDDARWGPVGFEKSLAQIKAEAGGTAPVTPPKVDRNAELQREAEAVRAELAKLRVKYDADLSAARARWTESNDRLYEVQNEFFDRLKDVPYASPEYEAINADILARVKVLEEENAGLLMHYQKLHGSWSEYGRKAMAVNDPIEMPDITWVKRTKKAEQAHIQKGFDAFRSLVPNRPLGKWKDNVGAEVRPKPFKRAHFDMRGNIVITPAEDLGTIVHELGHWLEWTDDAHFERAKAFRNRRTAGQPETQIYPGSREYGVKDGFTDHYTGKRYESGGREYATEITSMGLEALYADAVRFAETDPDFFDWLYRALRGGE